MPSRAAARYWPLGEGRVVTSPFGPRSGGHHNGVDFGRNGGAANMPVYAVQAGKVIYAGAAQGYGGPDPHGWLVIDSADAEGGGCIEYGHITRLPNIGVGAKVQAGQQIAVINPDSRTNGGCAPHLHLSDMPAGYDPSRKQDPMRRLAGAFEPGRKNDDMWGSGVTAVRLDYDRGIVPQTTSWSCGPGAAEIVLNAAGVNISEQQLIREIGTHTGGTDDVSWITKVLNRHLPKANYTNFYLPKDPPSREQKEALWKYVTHSIQGGYGVVMNWVVPPWNKPKSVPPSTKDLTYPNAWTYHYVACCGYDDDPAMRKVWIADSGFQPGGAWISFDQCTTLIPPKGISWANCKVSTPPTPEPEVKPPPVESELGAVHREVTQRLPGRTFDDSELRDFITDPRREDTMLGHAINAASLARVNYELLRRIAEKLDVEVGDIR